MVAGRRGRWFRNRTPSRSCRCHAGRPPAWAWPLPGGGWRRMAASSAADGAWDAATCGPLGMDPGSGWSGRRLERPGDLEPPSQRRRSPKRLLGRPRMGSEPL